MVETFYAGLAAFLFYHVYAHLYFGSQKFLKVKDSIAQHTKNCNDLNEHIEELKSTYSYIRAVDYGASNLQDNSRYNMKRKRWQDEEKNSRVHNCSASVVKNASNAPFKYLCKYFAIKTDEKTLSHVEEVLNNFAAAEQGKYLLRDERQKIVASIDKNIPTLISFFSKKKLVRMLGFNNIDLSNLYFPVYTFQYVSAGGNSAVKCEVKLNIENLDRFVSFIDSQVKYRKSVAGQRALMTSSLRELIKTRDNFTCKSCGLSTEDEKNLLLEIDHVIPLSKGGITSEENLQTLCWKCNRSKGAKIV